MFSDATGAVPGGAGTERTVLVSCGGAGQVATGGGGRVDSGDLLLVDSQPDVATGTPTQWQVTYQNNGVGAGTFTTFVVCAPGP